MFPHRNIHKYSWNTLDGKSHNKIDKKLIVGDRIPIYYKYDVKGIWLRYCVLSGNWNVRERCAVSKQAEQRFDGERFNLRKLIEREVKRQYRIEITNTFTAFRT